MHQNDLFGCNVTYISISAHLHGYIHLSPGVGTCLTRSLLYISIPVFTTSHHLTAIQLEKVNHMPLSYEKMPELSVALVATGAAAGKIVAGDEL